MVFTEQDLIAFCKERNFNKAKEKKLVKIGRRRVRRIIKYLHSRDYLNDLLRTSRELEKIQNTLQKCIELKKKTINANDNHFTLNRFKLKTALFRATLNAATSLKNDVTVGSLAYD